jgi:hypothetical protein
MARLIWLRRNNFIFQKVFSTPSQIVSWEKEKLELYKSFHGRVDPGQLSSVRLDQPHAAWCKP